MDKLQDEALAALPLLAQKVEIMTDTFRQARNAVLAAIPLVLAAATAVIFLGGGQ